MGKELMTQGKLRMAEKAVVDLVRAGIVAMYDTNAELSHFEDQLKADDSIAVLCSDDGIIIPSYRSIAWLPGALTVQEFVDQCRAKIGRDHPLHQLHPLARKELAERLVQHGFADIRQRDLSYVDNNFS